jgi:hypothetical protein
VVARQRRAVDAVEAARGMVLYHDEGWGPLRGYGHVPVDDSTTGLLREFFGLRWPAELYIKGPEVTDEVLVTMILPLHTLEVVGIAESSVTLDGLAILAALPALRVVTMHSDMRNEKITSLLAEATRMEFQDVPLQDCVEYLVDLHNGPIEIDKSAVTAEQWDQRSYLTASAENQTLGSALDTLLAPKQLGWVVRDGKLIITKREVQEEQRAVAEQMKAKLPQVQVLVID